MPNDEPMTMKHIHFFHHQELPVPGSAAKPVTYPVCEWRAPNGDATDAYQHPLNRFVCSWLTSDMAEVARCDEALQALAQLEASSDFKTRKSTVVFNEGWHKGVIGIVASRLTEKYYRPTIVLTQSNGVVAGSARSVIGFDLYEALLECTDLLEQFGGHKYAAGLTMKAENVPAFQQRFEEVVTASISDDLLVPEISIDSPLNLAQIDAKFFRILSQFEPFGPKNMSPVFMASGVKLAGAIGIVGDKHLKMQVKQGDSNVFDCIGFGLGKLKEALLLSNSFDMCFSIEENSWKDRRNIQLNIKDIRILEGNNVL
jgi:single-stranded-DNA-specific exonuclease